MPCSCRTPASSCERRQRPAGRRGAGWRDRAPDDRQPHQPRPHRVNNPGIDVVAASGQPGDERLAGLVRAATAEIHRRLVAGGNTTYDSLLTSVRDAVVGDPALRRRLAERFPVALIDEFQDTDPVQWEIFDAAFGDGAAEARARR